MFQSRVATVALILLLPLAACSDAGGGGDRGDSEGGGDGGGHETDQSGGFAEAPDELEPSWTADMGTSGDVALPMDSFTYRPRGDLTTWTNDGQVIMLTPDTITALDVESGKKAWTYQPPKGLGRICAATEDLNEAGTGGLLFAKRAGDDSCKVAGAFDTGTGRLRWSTPLADYVQPTSPREDNHLAISDAVISVVSGCDELRRLDVRTGKPLEQFLPVNEGCYGDIAFGPGIVLFSPDHSEVHRVEVHDQDTGREIRRIPVTHDTRVYDVLSTSPLVLDVEEDRHRVVRVFEGERPGKHLGLTSTDNFPRLFVRGRTLVASYDRPGGALPGPAYFGYDVARGKRLWKSGATDPRPLGPIGDDVLTQAQVVDPDTGGIQLWLGRATPGEGDDQETYGRLTFASGAKVELGWTDDLFLVRVGTQLRAYDLARDDLEEMPPVPYTGAADVDWAEGDVTTEQVAELCQSVTDKTLRGLGIAGLDLPPPSECHWTGDDDHLDRTLHVSASAMAPGENTDGEEATGVGRAHDTAVRVRDTADSYGTKQPVDDVGDEAWLAIKPDEGEWAGHLIVRQDNVLITITATMTTVKFTPGQDARPAVLAKMKPIVDDMLKTLD